ncbi:MAG: calcium-binding protein [Gammaproteobacteria bacterium]
MRHGNDTYLFGAGAGQDTISDYGSTAGNVDTVKIVGKLSSEVTLYRGLNASNSPSNDLVLKLNGTSDQLTIRNYYSASQYKVEQVVFDDGTVWTLSQMEDLPLLPSTATAYGTSGSETFDLRNVANTTAYGYTSSSSDSGNDTYLFEAGAGQDTISDYGSATGNVDTVKIVGKLPSDVTLYRGLNTSNSPSNDLVLKLNGTSDQLTIRNYYSASQYKVERVVFDDGTVWTLSQMEDLPLLPSTATAYGTSGSETFDLRNVANTTAYGYTNGSYDSGNDTYVFGAGAGQDTISDYGSATGNVDTVKIVGKLPSDVTLYRGLNASNSPSNDLVLKLNGTSDQLTIQNYYSATQYKVERVVFDDGTEWTLSQMEDLPLLPSTATAYGTSGSETFDLRNVANTTAYGYTSGSSDSGNDTYLFGAGAGQDTHQ